MAASVNERKRIHACRHCGGTVQYRDMESTGWVLAIYTLNYIVHDTYVYIFEVTLNLKHLEIHNIGRLDNMTRG